MKKLIFICFIALLLGACTKEQYEVTYVVYYPNHTKTYKMVVDGVPYITCYRGVNYLSTHEYRYYVSSIAPMEIVSYKELQTEDK